MRHSALLALAACALAAQAHANCGSAVCTVTTNWNVQAVPPVAGSGRIDLRYEFIDQSRPWAGTRKADVAGDDEAHETRTYNRNFTATLDYALSERWAVSLAAPLLGRSHDHVADPEGAATPESWHFKRLGDVRATTSLRFADDKEPLRAAGLLFGLKLPTGAYKVENADGVRAERSLQPGTGSTDVIVGAFATLPAGNGGLWFAQGTFQSAVKVHDQYRPGNQIQINGGYRHPLFAHLPGVLQVNGVSRRHDSGDNAEPDVTGGHFLFASPGLSYALSPVAELYGYVQVPVYRHVRGAQLTFDWAALVGASYRF